MTELIDLDALMAGEISLRDHHSTTLRNQDFDALIAELRASRERLARYDEVVGRDMDGTAHVRLRTALAAVYAAGNRE